VGIRSAGEQYASDKHRGASAPLLYDRIAGTTMHIRSFEITGLFGRDVVISSGLHSDINILTGRNGSGKTSVLKLLWYTLSGNIIMALREVQFKTMSLETDRYACRIHRLGPHTCRVEWFDGDTWTLYEDETDAEGDIFANAEDIPNHELSATGASIFLPTFRRIEGGFGIGMDGPAPVNRLVRATAEIEDSLLSISKKLTKGAHSFVCSISTVDIVGLLLRQISILSDSYNQVQQQVSQTVITRIKGYRADDGRGDQLDTANELIDQVMLMVTSMEDQREEIMAPVEAVRDLVKKLFRHSGIKMNDRLSFGDAAGAINSNALSAGEKQMLSFICYNAFYQNSVIFIDEPELSLHVDWQRQLFSILQRQQSTNQFIIATHSPFIYSKYEDKEVVIDSDRGDVEYG
jgi:predicted ATPase